MEAQKSEMPCLFVSIPTIKYLSYLNYNMNHLLGIPANVYECYVKI